MRAEEYAAQTTRRLGNSHDRETYGCCGQRRRLALEGAQRYRRDKSGSRIAIPVNRQLHRLARSVLTLAARLTLLTIGAATPKGKPSLELSHIGVMAISKLASSPNIPYERLRAVRL